MRLIIVGFGGPVLGFETNPKTHQNTMVSIRLMLGPGDSSKNPLGIRSTLHPPLLMVFFWRGGNSRQEFCVLHVMPMTSRVYKCCFKKNIVWFSSAEKNGNPLNRRFKKTSAKFQMAQMPKVSILAARIHHVAQRHQATILNLTAHG